MDGGGGGDSDLGFSHNLEWLVNESLAFIDETERGGDPWMLYCNPTAPHAPTVDEASLLLDYAAVNTPAGTLDAPPRAGTMPSRANLWARALEAAPANPVSVAGAMWVDDMLGAMLGALRESSVIDRTLVIFALDHGQARRR